MQLYMYQPKRWTINLKAKFPSCKISKFGMKVFKKKSAVIKVETEKPVSVVQKSKSLKYKMRKGLIKKLRVKVFKKKSAVIKPKTEKPVSVVQKSKSLECKIFKLLKKLGIKGTTNNNTSTEINASYCERLSYENTHENSGGGSAYVLRSQVQPNPVGNNGQGAIENYVTEKMMVGLILMSHYFLMLNKYVGSNKHNYLLIFIISMAMGYFTITLVRSIDQIEDFISGLVSRACSCYILL